MTKDEREKKRKSVTIYSDYILRIMKNTGKLSVYVIQQDYFVSFKTKDGIEVVIGSNDSEHAKNEKLEKIVKLIEKTKKYGKA